LLTIGAGTVIRKEAFLLCYRARAGRIETGRVTLGRDAFVGERAVLDIETAMGDGAQLGHASALHAGQTVPAGERWHGSPAQRTEVSYVRVPPAPCGALRRAGFCATTLALVIFVYFPLVEFLLNVLGSGPPSLRRALGLSLVLFFGAALVGLVLV